jgi:hypothetical protein
MFHSALRDRDLHSPSRELVGNNTGTTIGALRCVTFDSQPGAFPLVTVVTNPVTQIPRGLTELDIPNGEAGFITSIGFMNKVDTSPWTVGTRLYSSNTGALTTTPLGLPVATVMRQNATTGILYIDNIGITINDVGASSWLLGGNTQTDPSVNYIGTADLEDLSIRTNGIEYARLTSQGRIGHGTSTPILHHEQKSHTSPNASGIATATYYLETNSSSPQTAISYTLADPNVVSVEFVATARSADGASRAHFKRSAMFFREASSVQIQGIGWNSDVSFLSTGGYGVSYTMNTTTVIFRVQAPVSDNVRWAGYLKVQTLQ